MKSNNNNNDTEIEREIEDKNDSIETFFLLPQLPPELLSMSIGQFLGQICNERSHEVVKEIASIFQGKHWSYLTERFYSENDALELYKIIREITLEYQIVLNEQGSSFMKGVAQAIRELKGITSLDKLLKSKPSIDFDKITVANSCLLDIQSFLEQLLEQLEKDQKQKELELDKYEGLKKLSSDLSKIEQKLLKSKLTLQEKTLGSVEKTKTKLIKRLIKKQKAENKDKTEKNGDIESIQQSISYIVDVKFELDHFAEKYPENIKQTQNEIEQLKLALDNVKLVRETLKSNEDTYTENSDAYKKLNFSLKNLSKKLSVLFESIAQKYVSIVDTKIKLEEIHKKKKDIIVDISKKGGNMMVSGNVQDVPQYLSNLEREENNLINVVQSPEFQPTVDPFLRNKLLREKRKKELEQQQQDREGKL